MAEEVWGVTPQEAVLDHLYECAKSQDGFTHDLYGVGTQRAEAVMYVRDPSGVCWEITAKPHCNEHDLV